MLPKSESGSSIGDDSSNGKLLRELEAISKALYAETNPARTLIAAASKGSKPFGKPQLPDTKLKLNYGKEDPSSKEKKSIWNWKPLKAFSKNRKFNCCFILQVHSIEGLPSSFDNVSVYVHWKRRDGELVTRPVKVVGQTAEFEQKLTYTCEINASRNGPNNLAKYEPKHFLLFASVFGKQELDLGKHRVDLTRLLPLTLEELEEEEEKSYGKWTTSFKLSGEGKGATMNVSFGYTVVRDGVSIQSSPEVLNLRRNNSRAVNPVPRYSQEDGTSALRRSESLPGPFNQNRRASARSMDNIKDLHEVLPTSNSEKESPENGRQHKTDEAKLQSSVDSKQEVDISIKHVDPVKYTSQHGKQIVEKDCKDGEYYVTERGTKLSQAEKEKQEVVVKAGDISSTFGIACDTQVASEDGKSNLPDSVAIGSHEDKLQVRDCKIMEDEICSKEHVMRELESALKSVSKLENELNSPEDNDNILEAKNDSKTNRKRRSLSFDDATESLANEFLDMLGIEHSPFGLSSESEPESPRELLLRQFEKEVFAGGCNMFDLDTDDSNQREFGSMASTSSVLGNFFEDFELSSFMQAAEEEYIIRAQGAQEVRNKIGAKTLEDLETEALMREWGITDEAFQHSPPKGGFGSPIYLPPEEPIQLPPLGEELGPFLQTKDGGFLRSMNPSIFKNAKSGGSLIMQVSRPVVVPAEMGSDLMDILQQLASVGIEKLSMQANKLMPLEDITGKTIQQVAWEADTTVKGPERQSSLHSEPEIGQDSSAGQQSLKERPSVSRSGNISSGVATESGSEFVSLEDLAPLATNKIEALSVEGLRIQSGMADEDAPSNISMQSLGKSLALRVKSLNDDGSLSNDRTAGLQLLNIKDSGEDMDGLMDLSLTLDEWLRLDSGDIGDEDEISDRTSKILAAHHANSLDMIRGGSKGERRRGKGSSRNYGLLGNNFTVALMVQLRDPLRNYEPVGMPMLTLVQVERVFAPQKPKFYRTVSELRNDNKADDELVAKKEVKEGNEASEDGLSQFKITEVHVAGMKTEPEKTKLWGTTAQQQAGSRWLLANGMGKNKKNPFTKSKSKPGETLWSISSRSLGNTAKGKELVASNSHIRNPNLIFPNKANRLK